MNNEQPDWKFLAEQLRKPSGDFANEIGNRMNESNAELHQLTFDNLNLKPNDEVLEIGMGNGKFVQQLFKQYPNIHYTGLDYSKEMVNASLVNNIDLMKDNAIQFIHGNIEEFPYSEEIFDSIFTINTLYFWSFPDKTLQAIRRILKPNGQLIISIRPKHVMEEHPFTAHGFTLYNENELKSLLEKNAFEIIQVIHKKESSKRGISDQLLTFESLIAIAKKLP